MYTPFHLQCWYTRYKSAAVIWLGMGSQVQPSGQNGLGPCTSMQMRGAESNTHHPRTALERQKEPRHNLLKAVTAPLEENCVFQASCVFFTIFQMKMGYLNRVVRHTVTAIRLLNSFRCFNTSSKIWSVTLQVVSL